MKQWFVLVLVALATFCAAPLLADEAPMTEPMPAEAPAEAPAETAPVADDCEVTSTDHPLGLVSPLDVPVSAACSCKDLCKRDNHCGAGGVCLPAGPCGCKQCFYSS